MANPSADRHLDWEGLFNVRDLGGLRTTGGAVIRRGALVRSEEPDRLTEAGWAGLRAHGIRTVLDLRNPDERSELPAAAGLQVVNVPLDDVDPEYWSGLEPGLSGTPLYYRSYLDRFTERAATAVRAVARAEPGGVLVHCGAGRDRTGLVVLLVLALVDVRPEEIADDYELSGDRLAPLYELIGQRDQGPPLRALLERHGTTGRQAMLDVLRDLDVLGVLGAGGLTSADVSALRERML